MDTSVIAARLKESVDFQQCVIITVQKMLFLQKMYIFWKSVMTENLRHVGYMVLASILFVQ